MYDLFFLDNYNTIWKKLFKILGVFKKISIEGAGLYHDTNGFFVCIVTQYLYFIVQDYIVGINVVLWYVFVNINSVFIFLLSEWLQFDIKWTFF